MAKEEYELLYSIDTAIDSNESLLYKDERVRHASSTSMNRRTRAIVMRVGFVVVLLTISGGLYTLYKNLFQETSPLHLSPFLLARSRPLLPFVCPSTPFPSDLITTPQRPSTSDIYTSSERNNIFDETFLQRSRFSQSSGNEVQRILGRAMGALGVATTERKVEKRPFRVLVLGGSISICHGLAQSDCWPNLIKDYFRNNFDSSSSDSAPITELINLSQPATGSSYFGYCYPVEVELRSGGRLGDGPDLVIMEFGINDVWPINETAKKDVERLLRVLRGLPTNPAIIILDAASLKLAQTYQTEENPEALHLPAAEFYDIPILSMKSAMFGERLIATKEEAAKFQILFQGDDHHPNVAGHKVLLDILITYIEEQACQVQEFLLAKAAKRIGSNGIIEIDKALEIGGRDREIIQPIPKGSLFKLVSDDNVVPSTDLVKSSCLLVGTADARISPASNKGWRSYVQQSDKQYLLADVPGSLLTFNINVGKGGGVLVDFLRSRSYNLGEVLIRLDDEKEVTLTGHWELDWSIGVPHEVFSNIAEGPHIISFELLPPKVEGEETSFRLIAVITT